MLAAKLKLHTTPEQFKALRAAIGLSTPLNYMCLAYAFSSWQKLSNKSKPCKRGTLCCYSSGVSSAFTKWLVVFPQQVGCYGTKACGQRSKQRYHKKAKSGTQEACRGTGPTSKVCFSYAHLPMQQRDYSFERAWPISRLTLERSNAFPIRFRQACCPSCVLASVEATLKRA